MKKRLSVLLVSMMLCAKITYGSEGGFVEISDAVKILKEAEKTGQVGLYFEVLLKFIIVPAFKDGQRLLDPQKKILGKIFWSSVVLTGLIHIVRPFDNFSFEIMLIHRWLKKNPRIRPSFSIITMRDVQRLSIKYPDKPWLHEANEYELKSLQHWNKLSSTINWVNSVPFVMALGCFMLSSWKRLSVIRESFNGDK